MKMFVQPPCETKQEDKKHEESKGCAVFIERGYIADLDGLGAGCLHLDGVGVLHNAVAPFGVPFLQINGVGTNADKDAIVQIDAVALEMGGEVVGGGVGNGLHRVTGTKHKHGQEHCAQTDSGPHL